MHLSVMCCPLLLADKSSLFIASEKRITMSAWLGQDKRLHQQANEATSESEKAACDEFLNVRAALKAVNVSFLASCKVIVA